MKKLKSRTSMMKKQKCQLLLTILLEVHRNKLKIYILLVRHKRAQRDLRRVMAETERIQEKEGE